jgi:hypothetical protein
MKQQEHPKELNRHIGKFIQGKPIKIKGYNPNAVELPQGSLNILHKVYNRSGAYCS